MYAGNMFIASATFAGQLPGYAFTSRKQGVGYYKDANMDKKPHTYADEAEASNTAQAMPKSIALPTVLKPRLRTRAAAEELD